MEIKLNLLKPFSDIVGTKELGFEFDGKTLEELLRALVEKYPKMREELYSKEDELTDYISIFVNDKPLSAVGGVEIVLNDGDELLIFMPISGG